LATISLTRHTGLFRLAFAWFRRDQAVEVRYSAGGDRAEFLISRLALLLHGFDLSRERFGLP